MRAWLGLVVVTWCATAAADDATFSAEPLVGAVHGAVAMLDDDAPAPPRRTGVMTDANRKAIDRIVSLDSSQLGKFTGLKGGGPGTGTGTGTGTGKGLGFGPGGGGNVDRGVVAGKPENPAKVAFEPSSGDLGGLTSDEIDRVIRARAGVIRACYQRELNRTKGLSGKIVVRFKIDAAGVVTAATIASTTMKSSAVESCMISQIKRLKFPAKGAIANVSYPFIFTAG